MKKDKADYCKKIEIWWLTAQGYIKSPKQGAIVWNNASGTDTSSIGLLGSENDIELRYSRLNLSGERQEVNYRIPVTTTPCNFGGLRYWFICPMQGCGRRIGVLYQNGKYFACRHCHNLTYGSRNVNRRSSYYHLLYIFSQGLKIEKIEQNTRRYTYAGKLTKNARRIDRLYEKLEPWGRKLT